jgi:hypothetical protein
MTVSGRRPLAVALWTQFAWMYLQWLGIGDTHPFADTPGQQITSPVSSPSW